jgi:hypothetical protein
MTPLLSWLAVGVALILAYVALRLIFPKGWLR